MSKYDDLFFLLENVAKKQDGQKKRGLNNYNMVNVVRKATHEVGMHSNIIFSLINPDGEHFQGDLFLNVFIEKVILPKLGLKKLEDFGEVHSVEAEELTEENRRIDFTIKSENYLIGIEMKVNASDLRHQVSHYYAQLEKESTGQEVYIFYLTKFGTRPSPISLEVKKGEKTTFEPSKHMKMISFSDHILKWINASQKEVNNITNLDMALKNYKEIVEKITNKYKGNVVTITEELLQNKSELKLALELDKVMNQIKAEVLMNFFTKVIDSLKNNGYKDVVPTDLNRYVDDAKCKAYFKQDRNKPKYFGIFVDCGFGQNRYFHLEVAIKSIYYGVVSLDDSLHLADFHNQKIKEIIPEHQPSKRGGGADRYAHFYERVDKCWDDIIDFENSKLKDDIFKLIADLKNI